MFRLVRVAVLLLISTSALASDGVLEINQTCAVQTGCFPGDAPGFPVEITASGSYALTSNLGPGDLDGIHLATSRVSLDFRGFSLTGQTIGSGTGNGITGAGTNGSFAGFATIRNGVIRGARANGVALGGASGVRIEGMVFDFNAGDGVEVGAEATISRNTFSSNGGTALRTGDRSLIAENTVSDSGIAGILSGEGARVLDNIVSGSTFAGISTGDASVVSGNTSSSNGASGIDTGEASTISGNTAAENGTDGIRTTNFGIEDGSTVSGNTATLNGGHGIVVSRGSLVSENTANKNGDCGLSLFLSAYRGNMMFNNRTCIIDDRGPPGSAASINAGGNVCQASLCP